MYDLIINIYKGIRTEQCESGYLNDYFHLKKAILAFLGNNECLAEQKDMAFTPVAEDTKHILVATEQSMSTS